MRHPHLLPNQMRMICSTDGRYTASANPWWWLTPNGTRPSDSGQGVGLREQGPDGGGGGDRRGATTSIFQGLEGAGEAVEAGLESRPTSSVGSCTTNETAAALPALRVPPKGSPPTSGPPSALSASSTPTPPPTSPSSPELSNAFLAGCLATISDLEMPTSDLEIGTHAFPLMPDVPMLTPPFLSRPSPTHSLTSPPHLTSKADLPAPNYLSDLDDNADQLLSADDINFLLDYLSPEVRTHARACTPNTCICACTPHTRRRAPLRVPSPAFA